MSRSKADNYKLHKESERQKTTAKIYEVENGRSRPEFDVELVEDLRGFYKRLKLKATKGEESMWAKQYQGTTRVIVQNFDMSVEVVLPKTAYRGEIKFELPYCDLCDIMTALTAMEYLYKKRTGRNGKTPTKIGRIKTRKLK